MGKVGKGFAWGVGVLVLVLVAATVGLKLYLTKDRILAWTIPPLEEHLHRKVTVADAGAGFTGIHLDGLDVRAEGAPQSLVSAESLRIRWNLWALLSRKVEVKEILLVKPRIHLVRLPDGSLNVADLMASSGGPAKAPAQPTAAPAEGKGAPPVAVAVALISLQDGQITFEDRTRTPPQTYVLDAIDSRVTDLSLDRPFRYQLSAKLPLAPAGRFSAEGTVDPSTRAATSRVTVADFDLPSVNPLLQGGTHFASGVAGLDLNVKLSPKGAVDLEGKAGVTKLAFAAGEQAGQPGDLSVEVSANADPDAGTADLRKLDLAAAGQKVHLEARVTGLKRRPKVDFKVTSDELRVDPLTALLPPGGKGEGKAAPPAPSTTPASPKPSAIPMDAVGDVQVGRLLAGGLAVEQVAAHVTLEKGVLQVKPAGAKLYGGTLSLGTRAELEKAGPPFEETTEVQGVQIGDLLPALSPKLKDTMTGTLALSMEASGAGGDLTALNSKIHAEAKDGKILNQPLVKEFAQLFKVKELETLNFYSLRTEATTTGGTGDISAFVLSGPNLQATGRGTVGLLDHALDLQLAVALPKRIAAKVIPDPNVLNALTDREGWTKLPLKLGGTLEDPSYGLDTEGIARAASKALGGKAEKALEEKLLKKVPLGEGGKGALPGGLRKLFGQ